MTESKEPRCPRCSGILTAHMNQRRLIGFDCLKCHIAWGLEEVE